jgi:dehydrogenase/reductase SDR family protein 1
VSGVRPLTGRVALVTGASRGLGKGIALELGAAGATVYITGRANNENTRALGTIEQTAAEVRETGTTCIAVQCDQADDAQIAALIKRVEAEQGTLHILVNNAYPGPDMDDGQWKPFWESPLWKWRSMIDVGLRSHFVATVMAMPLLLKSQGLIINVSSCGSQVYLGSVPYGIGKAGMDRMIKDMAAELKGTGVTAISLWPGIVRTEFMQHVWRARPDTVATVMRMGTAHFDIDPWSLPNAPTPLQATESPRFTGRAVAALAGDAKVYQKTGRTLASVLLADEYGFEDVDGSRPDGFCFRTLRFWPPLAF